MLALPTGGGVDFLSRLETAEARDSSRLGVPQSSYRKKGATRRLTFDPRVVTRVENADMNVGQRMNLSHIVTPYSEDEMQQAMARQMVKLHLKDVCKKAEPEQRQKYHAIAADEAWRRADELASELASEDGWPSAGEAKTLKQRQHEAALRCQQQTRPPKQKPVPAPQPTVMMRGGGAPMTTTTAMPAAARPPSPMRALPGRVLRQESPRINRGPSPRTPASPRPPSPKVQLGPLSDASRAAASPRPASPRPLSRTGTPAQLGQRRPASPRRPGSPRLQLAAGANPRVQVHTTTRVRAPPGGSSSFVFG